MHIGNSKPERKGAVTLVKKHIKQSRISLKYRVQNFMRV